MAIGSPWDPADPQEPWRAIAATLDVIARELIAIHKILEKAEAPAVTPGCDAGGEGPRGRVS